MLNGMSNKILKVGFKNIFCFIVGRQVLGLDNINIVLFLKCCYEVNKCSFIFGFVIWVIVFFVGSGKIIRKYVYNKQKIKEYKIIVFVIRNVLYF